MTPDPHTPAGAPSDVPAPRRRRRWPRRVAIGLLVLVVLLLALVALAPTIAGSGLGRSIAAAQIGKLIHGSAKVDAMSFGWFGGQKIGGVKVYDAEQALVLEIDRIETDLTLAKALRGDLSLGNTVIDVNLTRLQVDPQGNTNYQRLLKEQPDAGGPSQPGEEDAAGAEIPNISGNITVKYRGTIEYVDRIGPGATPLAPPLIVEPGQAVVSVADVNSAIDNAIKLALRVGDRPAGSIELAGTIDAVDNNRLNLEKLAADQRLRLVGIDFASLTPLVKLAQLDGTLEGVMDGQLALKADGLTQATVEGQLGVGNFAAAGFPELNGDRFETSQVSIPIKASRTVADGATLLKVELLRVEMPELLLALAAELNEQALLNAAAGKAPGADGWAHATLAVKDLTLANRLRRTLHLQEDVQVTGGQFSQMTDLTLRRDKLFGKVRLDVEVVGTRGGQPVRLEPVSASADATYTPAVNPLEGLSELGVLVSSPFASLKGGGATLDKLDFTGDFDLARLREQAQQFVDLGGVELAGSGTFALGTKGELQTPDSDVAASARLNLTGINVSLPEQPPIRIGSLVAAVESTLRTAADGGIARIGSTTLSVTSGDSPDAKVLELSAAANNVDLETSSVEKLEISNLAISSLPKLQQQFGAFVPALKQQGIEITDGQLYTNLVGSYDGPTQTLRLTRPLELTTPNLTVNVNGNTLLNRERFRVRVMGNVGMADATTVDLSELSVTSSLFTLEKADAPLTARIDPAGAISGAGQVKVTADLAKVAPLAQAFGGDGGNLGAGAAANPPPTVRSGNFAATIDLAGGVGAESTVSLNGTIDKLAVDAEGGAAMRDEQVRLQASAKTAADLSRLAANATLASSFAEVNVTDATLLLGTADRPTGTYDMLQSADVAANVTDLAKLYALATAFSPPAAAEPAAAGEPPLPPLQVTGGGATLKLAARRDGQRLKLDIPDLRVTRLALARGEQRYEFDRETPISVKLAAELDAAGEELRAVRVNELSADLRVARLSMPTPITVTDVLTTPRAAGAVEADGKIDEVTPLLAVLQGTPEPLPYGGTFKLQQQLANAGDAVSLKGSLLVDNFAMREVDSGQWQVVEKQVSVRNDLAANLATSSADVAQLVVEMPQTKALSASLTGSITDWAVRRELRDVKLDLTYDWSRLWPIVLPLLGPEMQQELQGSRMAGAYTESFTVRGSLPADRPFHEAVRLLAADGQIRFDLIDAAGLNIEKLTIPLSLRDGKAALAYADRPTEQRFAPPATANGGTLNLNGFVVDLATPDGEPRLYGPKKQRITQRVSINPALGDKLGRFINPTLVNTERAKGLLDLTCEYVDGLALGEKLQTPESGKAKLVLSITELDIANPLGPLMFGQVAGVLKLNVGRNEADTFRGEIRDAVIMIENGRTTQELTITLREDVTARDPVTGKEVTIPKDMPLSFQGDIRLSDLQQKLAVSLPSALVGRFIRVSEKDMMQLFPSGVPITLGGTTTAPKVDVGNIGQRLIEAQIRTRIPGLTPGAGGQGGDPIGEIIRGLGGNRDRERPRDPAPAREPEQPLGRERPK